MMLQLEHEPVGIENADSESPLLLVCEHAGQDIPASLARLGVSEEVINGHFGWDIGALAVARGMAQRLNAQLVFQRYSRLVVDCNRPLNNPELIPEISESVSIPGNAGLPPGRRQERINAIWLPFQQQVGNAIDRRTQLAGHAILIAVHSFSPVYLGITRPWQVCLAYNRDARLGKMLFMELSEALPDYRIAMNQPFFVSDEDDHTIPVFGEARNIPHVLLEIRNDLLRSAASQDLWAGHIAASIERCLPRLGC